MRVARDGPRIDTVLPPVLAGTAAGALMSLGLNGSRQIAPALVARVGPYRVYRR